eukprot:3298872-Amphidinium_carterae.1
MDKDLVCKMFLVLALEILVLGVLQHAKFKTRVQRVLRKFYSCLSSPCLLRFQTSVEVLSGAVHSPRPLGHRRFWFVCALGSRNAFKCVFTGCVGLCVDLALKALPIAFT